MFVRTGGQIYVSGGGFFSETVGRFDNMMRSSDSSCFKYPPEFLTRPNLTVSLRLHKGLFHQSFVTRIIVPTVIGSNTVYIV